MSATCNVCEVTDWHDFSRLEADISRRGGKYYAGNAENKRNFFPEQFGHDTCYSSPPLIIPLQTEPRTLLGARHFLQFEKDSLSIGWGGPGTRPRLGGLGSAKIIASHCLDAQSPEPSLAP
eukprot:scaffold212185_cov30-Prasinocladus_malaysianus.AAC.1